MTEPLFITAFKSLTAARQRSTIAALQHQYNDHLEGRNTLPQYQQDAIRNTIDSLREIYEQG